MALLKNSYGVSIGFQPKIHRQSLLDKKFTGSSLDRKEKQSPDLINKDPMEKLINKPLKMDDHDEGYHKSRSLSPRSKSKIRKKVIAFGRAYKKLSFVTLTFLNMVSDRQAIKALGLFLDNVSKRSKNFQYLWVAEKQTKNEVFKNNIHFHLITNKYWNIDKWWNYWIDVQKKIGIIPRDENFKPSSAFDVKVINSNSIKGVGNYISKYVTKNNGEFKCQIWNCSRLVSQLYTCFYSEMDFLNNLKRLEEAKLLGGTIKTFQQEHCNIHVMPLNNITTKLYNPIDEKNLKVVLNFDNQKKDKNVT